MDRVHGIGGARRSLLSATCIVMLLAWNAEIAAFGAERERLGVRVYNSSVPADTFADALRDASRLLGDAGVDAEWHVCPAPHGAQGPGPDLCADPLPPGDV